MSDKKGPVFHAGSTGPLIWVVLMVDDPTGPSCVWADDEQSNRALMGLG